MLGQSGSRNKENEVNLALIDEDEELNDMGGFDSASFPTIDTLDEDDNDVREDDLNWYILVMYIWLMMVFFFFFFFVWLVMVFCPSIELSG